MTAIECPPAVRWIVRTLEESGYETWAVGGAVRDVLAGQPSVDWDLATLARPKEVRRTFRRTVPIGVEHGTVGVLSRDGTLYEVTTFRKDVETFGRHAVVEFADRLEDDLARRDFTINAVAWHPLRDELRDPWDGAADLRAGILRTVGRPADRFAEDHLRILRALRFAGRFGLDVEEETWEALSAAVDHIRELSPERVREEVVKVLRKDPKPARSLSLYGAAGVLEVAYPELKELVGRSWEAVAPAGREGTGRGGPDAWGAALATADILPRHRHLLRLTALLLDCGEGEGEGTARSDAADRAAALLTRLRFSNAEADRVAGLVRLGPELPDAGAEGPVIRRWLARVGRERVADVVRLAGARARVARIASGEDLAGTDPVEGVVASARALRRELRRDPPLTVGDLALDGRDLIRMGLKPGPHFGRILEDLLERVLAEPGLNVHERLEALVRDEVAADRLADGARESRR